MLKQVCLILLTLFLIIPVSSKGKEDEGKTVMSLPIPPLLEGEIKELTINKGTLTLPFGSSSTLGYNGNYLGPTIRMRRGELFKGNVLNTLNEDTTLHWHGMIVPAQFDGGPHQVIPAGSRWFPEFPIIQPASTLWYHPHLAGKTGEQVYRRLSGMFIIDDDYSDSLDIPREYGVNDIPLIFQEREIDRDGSFAYRPSMPDLMHGYLGNVMLLNGAFEPLLAIPPGERYEILIDFDSVAEAKLLAGVMGGNLYETLTVKTDKSKGKYYDHPLSFNQ